MAHEITVHQENIRDTFDNLPVGAFFMADGELCLKFSRSLRANNAIQFVYGSQVQLSKGSPVTLVEDGSKIEIIVSY